MKQEISAAKKEGNLRFIGNEEGKFISGFILEPVKYAEIFEEGANWQKEQYKDLLDTAQMLFKLCNALLESRSYKCADETIAFAKKTLDKFSNE